MKFFMKRLHSIVIVFILLTLLAPAPEPVRAGAVIWVTTEKDQYDAGATSGDCSLREAIIAANTNQPFGGCAAGTGGMDYIQLEAKAYVLDRKGAGENQAVTGDLDINQSVTISGTGMGDLGGTTIYADNDSFGDRLFHIRSGAVVYMNDLRLIGGSAVDYSAADPAIGAGIYNQNSRLYVNRVTFESNNSLNMGGGIGNGEGSYLEVNASRFKNNSAKNGGGIFNNWTALVNNSLFDTNTGTVSGGGFKNNVLDPNAKAVLTNVTFFGNTSNAGAGLFSDNRLFIINASIIDNQGVGLMTSGSGYIRSSILGLNTNGENCVFEVDGQTKFVSQGFNIEDNDTCYFQSTKKDKVNVLWLGIDTTLKNNGGTTETLALLEGSPAIDAAHPDCLQFDQRLFTRPAYGPGQDSGPAACDVGAFEYGATRHSVLAPIITR